MGGQGSGSGETDATACDTVVVLGRPAIVLMPLVRAVWQQSTNDLLN